MARSDAATPKEYLDELPPDRRAVVSTVRKLIRTHLPDGYKEAMRWGMLCYEVPLRRYPDTYNGEPLCYVGLAARKNGFSLYLMGAHADPGQARALKDAYRKAGKKLDMGKSCLRFKGLEDLETDAVAKVIASTPPEAMIAFAETARRH